MKLDQIRIQNLSKTYKSKGGVKVPALRGLTLDIGGGMTFVVGRSGCGKTTLLNLIGGIDKASEGEIYLENGVNVSNMSEKELNDHRNENIGFIFQEYYLLEELSVYANIEIVDKLQNKKAEEEQIKAVLDRLGLLSKIDTLVYELSGGEKQRVAIARALIKNPQIILADEPTGALDSVNGEALLSILKDLSKEKPVIVVSHDLAYAKEFADRIITLSDGKVIDDVTRDGDDFILTKPSETEPSETKKSAVNKQKKHGISLSGAFTFGLRGLLKKKVRLCASILTLVFALGVLGTLTAFIGYDPEKLFLNSMYTAGDYYLPVTPTWGGGAANEKYLENLLNTYGENYEGFRFVANKDITANNDAIYKIFSLENMNYNTVGTHVLLPDFEMDKELADALHYTLLEGKFPTESNEILISEFIFSEYKRLRYAGGTTISNYSDIIGKEVCSYTVVGVLDTNFDYKRYEKMINDPDNRYEPKISDIHYGAFFKVGFLDEYANKYGLSAFSNGSLVIDFGENTTPSYHVSLRSPYEVWGVETKRVTKFGDIITYQKLNPDAPDITESFPFGIVWKDGVERNELAPDEVVVPFEFFLFYNEFMDSFTEKRSEYENAGKSAQEALKLAKTDVAKEVLLAYADLFDVEINNFSRGVTIAGLYFIDVENEDLDLDWMARMGEYETENYMFYSTMFVSDALYGNYEANRLKGSYNYHIILDGADAKYNQLFLHVDFDFKELLNPATFFSYSPLADAIRYANTYLSDMAIYVAIAAAVLAVFAFISMFSCFSSMVNDEKRMIGILRTLGAKRSDIFKIYFSRALAISIVQIVLGIILSAVLISRCNSILYDRFLYDIALLSFGFSTIGTIVGLCVVAVFTAFVYPICKIVSSPPINAVRFF